MQRYHTFVMFDQRPSWMITERNAKEWAFWQECRNVCTVVPAGSLRINLHICMTQESPNESCGAQHTHTIKFWWCHYCIIAPCLVQMTPTVLFTQLHTTINLSCYTNVSVVTQPKSTTKTRYRINEATTCRSPIDKRERLTTKDKQTGATTPLNPKITKPSLMLRSSSSWSWDRRGFCIDTVVIVNVVCCHSNSRWLSVLRLLRRVIVL